MSPPFADAAVSALMALSDGDSAALIGELTPKVHTPQNGEATSTNATTVKLTEVATAIPR
jgi:hypothetical protein